MENIRTELTPKSFEFFSTMLVGRKLDNNSGMMFEMTSQADNCPCIKWHNDKTATVWMELGGNEKEFTDLQSAVDYIE